MERFLAWFNSLIAQIKAIPDEAVEVEMNREDLKPVLETDSSLLQLSPDICRFLTFCNTQAALAQEAQIFRRRLIDEETRAAMVSGSSEKLEALTNRLLMEEQADQERVTMIFSMLERALYEEYPNVDMEELVMRKGGVLVRPKLKSQPEQKSELSAVSIIIVPGEALSLLPGVRA